MAAEYVDLADGAVDPWAVHLPGRETVPAYLVAQHAAQYRAIVDVLPPEQDSSLTGCRSTTSAQPVRHSRQV